MSETTARRRPLAFIAAAFGALAISATGVGALVVSTVSAAHASTSFSNAAIADTAARQVGRSGGQCYVFVYNVLLQVSNGQVNIGGADGSGYRQTYVAAGGRSIPLAQARKGDVIQLNSRSTSAYVEGMHTAIVLDDHSRPGWRVVDSNWGYSGIVHIHAGAEVTNWAAQQGLQVNVWRFGTVSGSPVKDTTGVTPSRGSAYHVTASPSLKVHAGPGTQYPNSTTLPDGVGVTISCQERTASEVGGSYIWDRLSSGGWVADDYIDTPNFNGFTPGLPVCRDTDSTLLGNKMAAGHSFMVTASPSVNLRSGPGESFPIVGHAAHGATVTVLCQFRTSSSVLGSTIWDKLSNGMYVSDYWLNTPGFNQFAPGLEHR